MKKVFLLFFAIAAFFVVSQSVSTVSVHACSDPHWSYCEGDPTPTPTPCNPAVQQCPDPGVGGRSTVPTPSPSPNPKDGENAHWYDFFLNWFK